MSYCFQITNGKLNLVNGKPVKLTKESKLSQEILKIIITPVGSNTLYPWYGSLLESAAPGVLFDPEFINSQLKNYIISSLANLQKLQSEQIKYQNVHPNELLGTINFVNINQNITDPRFLKIEIGVTTKAGNRITAPTLTIQR